MTGPIVFHDKLAWPLMDALRTCAAAQFGYIGRPVTDFAITAGSTHPPADRCACTGPDGAQGVAWVRMTNQMLSEHASLYRGAPTVDVECHHELWVVDIEVGVYRCWPATGTSKPPTTAQIEAAAAGIVDDTAALRRTLRCCPYLKDQDVPWFNPRIVQLGPTGGCIGTALTSSFTVTDAPCPGEACA